MKFFALSLLAATAQASSVSAKRADTNLSWSVQEYDDIAAEMGDAVTLTYSSSHNVYEFPDAAAYEACDFSSAVEVGGRSDGSFTHIVTASTAYFGCEVGSHCRNGQKIAISGPSSKRADTTLSWSVQEYDDIAAEMGDAVTLTYSSSHNVYEFPDAAAYEACDFSSAVEVGGRSDGSFTHIVTASTAYFGCEVGSHCRNGQKIAISGPSSKKIVAKAVTVSCPGSSAPIHCGGTVEAIVAESCDAVLQEVKDRVNSLNGWYDAHNNGTYTLLQESGNVLSLNRVTGDGQYTDLVNMDFTDSGSSCSVTSCSESQVFSIGDFSTNYCNQFLLLCGSADGCRVSGNDAAYTELAVTTLAAATTKKTDCFAI